MGRSLPLCQKGPKHQKMKVNVGCDFYTGEYGKFQSIRDPNFATCVRKLSGSRAIDVEHSLCVCFCFSRDILHWKGEMHLNNLVIRKRVS